MAQSFGEGWLIGLQIADVMNKRRLEQSIDEAGKSVKEELQREKEERLQREQAQQELFARSNTSKPQETPSTYQQGDSLGLQGYQTGSKPIQTTVPTAPAGYGTREDGTTTDQTLIGNYGTTASFKGEKPTAEDTRMMQKDLQRPFNGPQDNNVLDLAQIKPEVTPQEAAKPKILDTLNEQITAADRAKDAYDYNTRVIQKLQQSGNARAALEFGNKVAGTELTLAQADHMKFNTVAALSKKVGDMASNALESIQQPGADVNKIFFDTMSSAKTDLGYTGKVPFSLDPNENIKTLQMLQKNSLTTSEKADLGIKQAVASQKAVLDRANLAIEQDKLTLSKINTNLAIGKEVRESGTAAFNRLTENTKLQFQALNSINSVMDEDYKKALKVSYDANLKTLQQYSKTLNISMPNISSPSPGNPFVSSQTLPNDPKIQGIANPFPTTQPNDPKIQGIANPSPNTQPVNNAFPADVLKDAGVADEAGGYVPPTPKNPAQVAQESKARAATKENIKAQIEALKESTDAADIRMAKSAAKGLKTGYKAASKVASEAGKAISDWAVGKDQAEVNAKIMELQKQLDALK